MIRNIIPLCLLLLVAACGTPQERCISRNSAELYTISNLLAEVEGNLARGYAWEERVVTRSRFTTCNRVVRDREGNRRIISTGCWRDVADTQRFRKAIDPAAETRKAEALRERQAVLIRQQPAIIAACEQAYPEKD